MVKFLKTSIKIEYLSILSLFIDGVKARATLNDSEIVYLENLKEHSVIRQSDTIVVHNFKATILRNGSEPEEVNVEIIQVSPELFVGTVSFKSNQ